jgi:hypothetical protein
VVGGGFKEKAIDRSAKELGERALGAWWIKVL